MIKKNIITTLILGLILSVQTTSADFFDNRILEIKGMWHGVVPKWMPTVCSSLVGFITTCVALQYCVSKPVLFKKNIIMTGATIIFGGLATMGTRYVLHKNTAHGLCKQAKNLIEQCEKNMLYTHYMNENDYIKSMCLEPYVTKKYYYIEAAKDLEHTLIALQHCLNKCVQSVIHTHNYEANSVLIDDINGAMHTLEQYRTCILKNLTYIKTDKAASKIFYLQLQLLNEEK